MDSLARRLGLSISAISKSVARGKQIAESMGFKLAEVNKLTASLCVPKYENYGVGTDQSDREWFIKPWQEGKVYVSDFFISKMTGILCFTVSAPIVNDQDEMIGIFGVDIQFEDWVKRAEDMDHIALRAEYKEVKSKAKHGHY